MLISTNRIIGTTFSCKIFSCKNFLNDFQKLTALLEYFDFMENFHVRNFQMILAYEI